MTTNTDTSDFLRRAGYALHDMQGRVEDGKLEMFWQCIKRLEALSAAHAAALVRERDANAKAMQHLRRAEAAEAKRDALKVELAVGVELIKQAQPLVDPCYLSSDRDWQHKTRAFLARHQKETGA